MIIGISGITTDHTPLFSNGYVQNVKFFCEFMKKHFQPKHTVISLDSKEFLWKFDHIDIMIQFSPFTNELSKLVRQRYPNCRQVFVKYGHEYYMDLQRLLPKGQNDISYAPKAHDIDELWMSPHFVGTRHYYQALYSRARCVVAPFMWKPDNLTLAPYTQADYDAAAHEKNIYIIEPNINMFKTSLIPMLIVNEVWKRNPNAFNKLYIVANNAYNTHEYFNQEILPKIEVLHGQHQKAWFTPRAPINDIFTKPSVMLSHQENLELNYSYLEALHLRLVWVHNSPVFRNQGYYYDKLNIFEGADRLEQALNDWKAIDYSTTVEQYNPDNPDVINAYKQLVEGQSTVV